MRDIYKTAKKAQMAPVRGRVKAMMAQPRAIPQARKIARQTTGFKKGGVLILEEIQSDVNPTITTIKTKKKGKQAGGTIGFARGGVPEDKKKRKPSPQPGLRRPKPKPGPTPAQPRPKAGPPAGRPKAPEAGPPAGRPEERPKAPKAGPPARSPEDKYKDPLNPFEKKKKEEPGMYVKKGGVVQKAFLGKLMEMFGKNKKATAYGDPAKQGGPDPTRKQIIDTFKQSKAGWAGYQKGGVTQTKKAYNIARMLADKDRMTKRDIERAKKLSKIKWDAATEAEYQKLLNVGSKRQKAIDKALGFPSQKVEPKKKGGKVDKKWIQKAVNPKHKGYCTPMTKPTCTPARKRLAKLFKKKAKKGWANGGTVVMPTVGDDIRTRAYKHGAVISPRPRPTVPHGSRMRGTGIAKRGW